MSMTMEHVVTQLQQELFSLRAQVAAESGLADAVRAINNLAAQFQKDTPSFLDVKGLGRPKESTVHWLRGGFPTVVEENGGILRWCDQEV